MVVGRLCGWLLAGFAILMASADVVLALGPGEHAGIATGDVWTLLAGQPPVAGQSSAGASLATLGVAMMAAPAWAIIGPVGVALAWLCRHRPRRHRLRIRSA